MKTKWLVIQVAGLGWDLVQRRRPPSGLPDFQRTESIFPALTCSVQGTLRTGRLPSEHGIVGNGYFCRALARPLFWEQSARLVEGPRIWEGLRARGGKVGVLFWQQSLGEAADLILSPRPIHKHHGGMIQDCYSQPEDLYARLCAEIGRPFNLMHYWGPLAGAKSSEWIARATEAVLRDPALSPDLLLTYLPHLDYDLQRHGPESQQAFQALEKTYTLLSNLWKAAAETGYEVVVFGDYAIEAVAGGPVFPNRALREAGLFKTRTVRGMLYPDFFASHAFAVVDHQIAQVQVSSAADVPRVHAVLSALPGVAAVLGAEEKRAAGLAHARAGELVLVAEKGFWLAYPWWMDKRSAPDYATHVDIHNKPGYDPCELFFGWPPMSVSLDATRIRGTHGRTGPGTSVAWASSRPLAAPATLLELARELVS